MKKELVKWETTTKKLWIFCKKKRIIWSIICLETRIKLKKKTKLCKRESKLKKDRLLSLKKTTIIFRIVLAQLMIKWTKNSIEREKIWTKDARIWLLKFQSVIEQFFLLRTRKKVWIIRFNTKISNWMSQDKKLNRRKLHWYRKLKTLKLSMMQRWMKILKAKLISSVKKLLKIRRLLSKNKESKIIIFRWSRPSTDMRSVLRVRKKMLKRFFKREFKEFSKKRRMLKRSTNKRENHLKT